MKWNFLFLLLGGCATERGVFIDRGLYNNSPFASARARSPDAAKVLALAAVPSGFEVDPERSSPVVSCGLPGEAGQVDEAGKSNSICRSGLYRVDIALLPKTGFEREAILRTRRDFAATEAPPAQ